jgi:hypothetical protein
MEHQIASFFASLYVSISDGDASHKWPSGSQHCVDAIKLISKTSSSIPIAHSQQVERRNYEKRLQHLPELVYHKASYGFTFDVTINNVRVQDKVAQHRPDCATTAYRLTLSKCGGTDNGKLLLCPYAEGDFDALWIFLPDNDGYFIIPSDELIKHGILTTSGHRGKTGMTCYRPSHKISTFHIADTWTSQYFVPHKSDDELTRIRDILFDSQIIPVD